MRASCTRRLVELIKHIRNLALQAMALCLQKMGRRELQQCQQMPQSESSGAGVSQLKAAECASVRLLCRLSQRSPSYCWRTTLSRKRSWKAYMMLWTARHLLMRVLNHSSPAAHRLLHHQHLPKSFKEAVASPTRSSDCNKFQKQLAEAELSLKDHKQRLWELDRKAEALDREQAAKPLCAQRMVAIADNVGFVPLPKTNRECDGNGIDQKITQQFFKRGT
ncbi:hypothetical protein WJX77_009788 [Trebouxia sp. C0004]